jgi:NAD(P) transhydrogenase subunit alpha
MMQMALLEHAAPAAGGGHGELDVMGALFVFMLATFIGVMVIQRVSRLLHTPLMSLTNAISAIAVVGAIIVSAGKDYPGYITALGLVAIFCSTTTIVSGFLITDRMLKMFKKQGGSTSASRGEPEHAPRAIGGGVAK